MHESPLSRGKWLLVLQQNQDVHKGACAGIYEDLHKGHASAGVIGKATEMEGLHLYQDLATLPWLVSPEQQALLEGVELSGPGYVASSFEPSASCTHAAGVCARPPASSKLSTEIHVMSALGLSLYPALRELPS